MRPEELRSSAQPTHATNCALRAEELRSSVRSSVRSTTHDARSGVSKVAGLFDGTLLHARWLAIQNFVVSRES